METECTAWASADEDSHRLTKGTHTLSIKALDDHIIADQWMIDFCPDREFYVIPQNNEDLH